MLGKPGTDYIMDKDTQAIIDSHDGDVKQMKYTMGGLNVEIQYIRESKHLTPEQKEKAVQRYKEVIEVLRKEVEGEKED